MNLARLIWFAFGVVSVLAVFSIPYRNVDLALGSNPLAISIAVTVSLVALFIAIKGSDYIHNILQYLINKIVYLRADVWVLLVIAGGMILRFLWIFYFGSPLESDSATYFKLAQNLYEQNIYQDMRGDRAYWPPGYPFFIYANFLLFGVKTWTPVLANLVLYALTIYIVYSLARLLLTEEAARLSILFLAVWPNYIFLSGIASKEMLLATLLPLSILLYVLSIRTTQHKGFDHKSLLFAVLSGITLGFSSLTQPSMLLLPGVLLIDSYLRRKSVPISMLRLGVIAIGMLIIIAPWTIRNNIVFDQWVPISTNGGDVFYRANNPMATGGYISQGERSLDDLDELKKNQLGYKWGMEWISSNPLGFLSLAIKKQVLFLGDDSTGAYETLKRGLKIDGGIYIIFKGLSNLYWLGIWIIILASWKMRAEIFNEPNILLLVLSFMYLFLIDSIFESGARHHIPLVGILAVLAAVIAVNSLKSKRAYPLVLTQKCVEQN